MYDSKSMKGGYSGPKKHRAVKNKAGTPKSYGAIEGSKSASTLGAVKNGKGLNYVGAVK